MADIFIGYAREDRRHAERLARALEAQGWSVWWDERIQAGKEFDEVIEQAIDAARCVIVLWSKKSVASDWVREEAQEGKRKGVLVPALIEADVKIPLGFRRMHAADLVGWDGSGTASSFKRLVSDLAARLGSPSEPAARPRERQPVRSKSRAKPASIFGGTIIETDPAAPEAGIEAIVKALRELEESLSRRVRIGGLWGGEIEVYGGSYLGFGASLKPSPLLDPSKTSQLGSEWEPGEGGELIRGWAESTEPTTIARDLIRLIQSVSVMSEFGLLQIEVKVVNLLTGDVWLP